MKKLLLVLALTAGCSAGPHGVTPVATDAVTLAALAHPHDCSSLVGDPVSTTVACDAAGVAVTEPERVACGLYIPGAVYGKLGGLWLALPAKGFNAARLGC